MPSFRDLIPADAFDEGTKSVLANAAYFKGSWKSQFKAEDTKKDNFYVKRDKVGQRIFSYYISKGTLVTCCLSTRA